MINYSLEDIEFIKILANYDFNLSNRELDPRIKSKLASRSGAILREYYKENTIGESSDWILEFKKLGITEDDGKAAISCARRFGLEFF